MRRIPLRQRLAITGAGAIFGLAVAFIAIARDRGFNTDAEGVAIFLAVAGTTAVLGAALTRRWATAIFAALVAAASPFGVIAVAAVLLCASGYCD